MYMLKLGQLSFTPKHVHMTRLTLKRTVRCRSTVPVKGTLPVVPCSKWTWAAWMCTGNQLLNKSTDNTDINIQRYPVWGGHFQTCKKGRPDIIMPKHRHNWKNAAHQPADEPGKFEHPVDSGHHTCAGTQLVQPVSYVVLVHKYWKCGHGWEVRKSADYGI